jgi:hypothetical protein
MFLLAKEMNWSKKDLYEYYGHEIISQIKRLKDWKKKNPLVCPILGSGSKG